jgi:hypothetical protein
MARGQALAAPIPQQLGWSDGRELVEQGQGRAAGVDLACYHGEKLRRGKLGCCQSIKRDFVKFAKHGRVSLWLDRRPS